ncbi:MAG: AAA family ATPase, partial [Clostridium sp.]
MLFTRIRIRNYKGIRDMELGELENAVILVGKNNTGKTSVLDAVRILAGVARPEPSDFDESRQNIEIEAQLLITPEDRAFFHR